MIESTVYHKVNISSNDLDAIKGIKDYFWNSEDHLAVLAYRVLKRITDQTEPKISLTEVPGEL